MASGEYNGQIGENIPEFDGDIAKPTREDIRELLETKIFLFNFSFNAIGSNKPDSTVDRKRVPYKKIAEDLYKTYRLYKAQSNQKDYSLTPQTYVAYIKGKRGKGLTYWPLYNGHCVSVIQRCSLCGGYFIQ